MVNLRAISTKALKKPEVKELLKETDLPLFEISYRSGFEHVSYMSYLFKRETGITPGLYRERTA